MLHRTLVLPARRSCFVFGPLQTGKSTLVRSTLPKTAWTVDLLRHDLALRYAKDPSQFGREAEQQIAAAPAPCSSTRCRRSQPSSTRCTV